MQLTVLGSGSGGPYMGRAYTAHFLQVEQYFYLLDCGEGTQMQLFRTGCKVDRITEIFLTHLHGDHIYGLPGLLMSFWLKGRTQPLTLYAPPGLSDLLRPLLGHSGIPLPYPLHFQEIDPEKHQCIFENKILEVWTLPLSHRVPTCGYLFKEKPKPRNVLKPKIEALQLSVDQIKALKGGADIRDDRGILHANADLTIAPSPAKSFAFCTDTIFYPVLSNWIKNVDLLYHEATYGTEHTAEAAIANHSTAAQAARIAEAAGAGKLLIGHFSARYTDLSPLLQEAQAIFPRTELAVDGLTLTI